MRLVSLSIQNFRSYRDRTVLELGEFTSVMGRNDVGKSTLLEALEIFFNNQIVKIEQNDACVHSQSKIIEIGCIFDGISKELTLDTRSITTLTAEHLLNSGGFLEIVKRFDCRTKTPKEEVFARANHPTSPALSDLLRLRIVDLRARAAEVGADLEGVDQRSNTALRKAIRDTVGDTHHAETLIPLAEEDGKRIWEQLQKHLPAYALFQSDRPSKDDDPEIADPMKIAVAAAVRAVEGDLELIKQRVQRSAMEVAERTLAKIREMDPSLAQQLTPSFKAEPKWDGFKLSLTGDDQIPINKRGSGVRRLILLNFFRAETERRREDNNSQRVIYAIEEPESSQHPDNQIMLVKALLALSEDPKTQVLMTTHVPSIAGLVPVECVRFVSRNVEGAPQIEVGNENVLETVAQSLGIYPDKRAQIAVFVEGPHDVSFLECVSSLYYKNGYCPIDLSTDHRIAFIPTGGGNLKHWVEKRYVRNAKMIEVHIYDRDTPTIPKYGPQVDAVNGRGTRDIAYLTERRELENYLHPACIADEYLPEFSVQIVIDDWCDVPALVAASVHSASGSPTLWNDLSQDKRAEKESRVKIRLNRGASARMTFEQLLVADQQSEILGWLNAIAQRLN